MADAPVPREPVLDAATLARIRAEESARAEVRAALAPRREQSRFDKVVALANTNVGIGTIGAVVIAVAGWAYGRIDEVVHRAEREADRARARALVDVQNVSPFLPMLAKPDSPERGLACRVLAHMIASKAINDTLGEGLAAEAGNCVSATLKAEAGTPEGQANARALAATLKRTNDDTAQPAVSAATQALAQSLPKRVYVQIARESQRPFVVPLRKAYEERGWIVPPAEVVGDRAPSGVEVRYFNDADREAAEKTLDDIRASADAQGLHAASMKVVRFNAKAPLGQIEVWLPKG